MVLQVVKAISFESLNWIYTRGFAELFQFSKTQNLGALELSEENILVFYWRKISYFHFNYFLFINFLYIESSKIWKKLKYNSLRNKRNKCLVFEIYTDIFVHDRL